MISSWTFAVLFSFGLLSTLTAIRIEEEDERMCADMPRAVPKIRQRPPPSAVVGPQPPGSYLQERRDDFVPMKILFVIDDQMSSKEMAKLEMATQYVNDRLSKIVEAHPLHDVRMLRYQDDNKDDNCSTCYGRKHFTDEYKTSKCYAQNESIIPGEGASQRILEQNKQDYTLVLRVLVNGEGSALGIRINCTNELAHANDCGFYTDVGPSHGYMVFCKKPSEFKSDEQLNATALHEALHVIIPSFRLQASNLAHQCRGPQDCKDKTWTEIPRQMIDENGEIQTVTSFLAIADRLPEIARQHFNCASAIGLELHMDNDTDTYPSQHWSARWFPDEIMSPKDSSSVRLSALTLGAIAAHRGWYRVNMSYAEPLTISRPSPGMGCEIMEKSCHEIVRQHRELGGVQLFRPYCDRSQGKVRAITSHCSDDHKRRYHCAMALYQCASLSGGRQAYDTDVCESATKMDREWHQLPYNTGAWFGPGTICVTFTDMPGVYREWTHAVCVLYECEKDTHMLVLKLFPGNWTTTDDDEECYMRCPANKSGQIVTVTRKPSCSNMNIGPTSLICPDYEVICEPKKTTTTETLIVSTLSSTSAAKVFPTDLTVSTTRAATSASKRFFNAPISALAVILIVYREDHREVYCNRERIM